MYLFLYFTFDQTMWLNLNWIYYHLGHVLAPIIPVFQLVLLTYLQWKYQYIFVLCLKFYCLLSIYFSVSWLLEIALWRIVFLCISLYITVVVVIVPGITKYTYNFNSLLASTLDHFEWSMVMCLPFRSLHLTNFSLYSISEGIIIFFKTIHYQS